LTTENNIDINIPGYRVRKKIGEGGFAKVYLAEQTSLERDVALKIISSELVSDKQFCDRFIKEGKIIARMSEHPNIITIHDIGCHEGTYYMSMEYVAGGDLSDRMKTGISAPRATEIIRYIALALSEAHKSGFIHRDIKPANVLFKADRTPVLTDFGIAKSLTAATQLTQAGFAVGTPDYMSPEQAMSREVDGRSDLYSLGVMYYELLTGTKPFTADDAFSVAVMHINEPPPPLPKALSCYQPLLDKLMAKEPEQRFADANVLIEALDQLPEAARTTATTANGNSLHTSRRGTSGLKPGLFISLGLGILAAGAVIAAVFIMDTSQQESGNIQDIPLTTTTAPPIEETAKLPPKIQRLLEVAALHEEFGRIREPRGSSACDAYSLILDSDPGNQQALEAHKRLGCEKP